MFAIIDGTLVQPWPYQGYDRIVTVRGTYPSQGRVASPLWSVAEIEDLRRAGDVFAHVIAGDARNVNLTYAGRPERVRAAVITPNAFTMLGIPAFAGRALSESDARPGAAPVVVVQFPVLADAACGATRSAVGATLRIAGVPYVIAGVMPRTFVFWDRDLWMPLSLDPAETRSDRRYYVQAQLQRRAVPSRWLRRGCESSPRSLPLTIRIMLSISGLAITLNPLVEGVLRDLRPTLYILLAAVGLVLTRRHRKPRKRDARERDGARGELAIRRAIGGSAGAARAPAAGRRHASSAPPAGRLAPRRRRSLLPHLLSLIPFGYVPAEATVLIDWRIVGAATTCAVVCGLLVGLVPALRAAAIDPAVLLKQVGHAHRFAAAAPVARRVRRIAADSCRRRGRRRFVRLVESARRGYPRSGISDPPASGRRELRCRRMRPLQRAAQTIYRRILRALRGTGSITDAAMTSALPVGDLPTVVASAETTSSTPRLASVDAATMVVSPTFFHVLGVPILEGRTFADDDDRTKPSVAIVSLSLARRLWPDGRTLGRRLVTGLR